MKAAILQRKKITPVCSLNIRGLVHSKLSVSNTTDQRNTKTYRLVNRFCYSIKSSAICMHALDFELSNNFFKLAHSMHKLSIKYFWIIFITLKVTVTTSLHL